MLEDWGHTLAAARHAMKSNREEHSDTKYIRRQEKRLEATKDLTRVYMMHEKMRLEAVKDVTGVYMRHDKRSL